MRQLVPKKEIWSMLIKAFFSDDFCENVRLIPFRIRPQNSVEVTRCCVYKDRAVARKRLLAAMGLPIEWDDETIPLDRYASEAYTAENEFENALTILQTACDGCHGNEVFVTNLCHGCPAEACFKSCKFGAISFDAERKSVIDQTKCKKCQRCVAACPYNAIVKLSAPCEKACPLGAIHKDETGRASIDPDKCISCGRCIPACPFSAVCLISRMLGVLKAIKDGRKVVALLAPSAAGQFAETNVKQLKTALIKAGFYDAFEVAWGADVTARLEANEFRERMARGDKFMTTSCCAGYRQLVAKQLPEIAPYVSSVETPMHYTAEYVKQHIKDAVVVFLSPCAAKMAEDYYDEFVDFVINFGELEALFDALEINPAECEETEFELSSSREGRNFANTGGVSEAVQNAMPEDIPVKICRINGMDKENLAKLRRFAITGEADGCSLVEVMCCEGGCAGGNMVIRPREEVAKQVAGYSKEGRSLAD